MRPWRIMLVTPDIVGPVKNGGIGTACFHYARSLANAGHEISILFSGDIGEEQRQRWKEWYRSLGIDFYSLDDVPGSRIPIYGMRWYTERSRRIMEFLRVRAYDYILFQDWHANGFWAAKARQQGAGFQNTKMGVITHSPNEWQKAGMRSFGQHPLEEAGLEWAEREQIATVDVLISPSHHMVAWLRTHGYQMPGQVVVCPYTFEDPPVAPRPDSVDRDHIIFFGRLETRKGLHLLGDALKAMRRAGEKLPLKISFLGKYAEVEGVPTDRYLGALAAELGDIEFHIEVDFDYMQAVEYIRSANGIVVIPSILDNYPLTVLESIINGFCFIASDAGGIPEMIDPAICFPATSEGLRHKLAGLNQIDFTALKHPFTPDWARDIWLSHVGGIVNEVRAERPSASIVREEIPPISVCVPFYRHDRYLPRMVGAFLRMGLPQLQLCVVDDGTPPAERSQFDRLRRELEPLGHVFHSQKNSGPGVARNKAAELARSEMLLFFDADNVPFPDMVEQCWRALTRTGADSVGAPFFGVPPMERYPTEEETVFLTQPQGGPLVVGLFDNVVGDACALMRRPMFEALGGFSATRAAWEDWEFFIRAVAAGYKHVIHAMPLFYYTADPHGRNGQAKDYNNRLSLLSCLENMPSGALAQAARALVIDGLVAARRS